MLKIDKITRKIKINFTNLISYLIIFLMICLIVSPLKYINSATDGILIWVNKLLPSLFPFFVLSKILIDLKFLENFSFIFNKVMEWLFGLNGSCSYIYLISLVGGYPLGSKLVLDAYNSGKISQTEAYRLTTITSVSGPLFIVGSVGTSMLFSQNLGYIMFISHIIGSIFNGITYRKYKVNNILLNNDIKTKENNNNILINSIKSSIESILFIGGLVCIFYVGMQAINSFVPLHPITQGIIEITIGCYQISLLPYSSFIQTIICCAIITFGGLCTHAQAMFFLKQANISYSFFLKQKITHCLYSTIVCVILCLIFKI